ncbi:MAG: hypothetical protein V4623_03400 [Pseudomonadota bacterium]
MSFTTRLTPPQPSLAPLAPAALHALARGSSGIILGQAGSSPFPVPQLPSERDALVPLPPLNSQAALILSSRPCSARAAPIASIALGGAALVATQPAAIDQATYSAQQLRSSELLSNSSETPYQLSNAEAFLASRQLLSQHLRRERTLYKTYAAVAREIRQLAYSGAVPARQAAPLYRLLVQARAIVLKLSALPTAQAASSLDKLIDALRGGVSNNAKLGAIGLLLSAFVDKNTH